MSAVRGSLRLLALSTVLAMAGLSAPAASAATASTSISVSIVVPPHCMEVLGEDAMLEDGLRSRHLLCNQKTGVGKLIRIELGQYAKYAQGEPNVVHRGGFD